MGNVQWIGILCVIGGLGSLGLMQSNRKRHRLSWLQQLEWNLRTLEQKILQLHMPLALALNSQGNVEKDELAQCFGRWGNLLYHEREWSTLEAWKKIVHEQVQWDYITVEDKKLMEKFALQVGSGSEEEERRLFQFILAEVKNQQEQAKEKIQSECRLWNYGGFMAGIVIVLLFL